MPINLELKAKIVSPQRILRICRRIAKPAGILHQTDTYFFMKKGRLKLREFSQGEAELIYYSRNEKRGARLSRYERLDVSNPMSMKKVLGNMLGILAVVKKNRSVFIYKGKARIHVDRVQGLGNFIEFEVFYKADRRNAQRTYNELLESFNIHPIDLISCSYSDLRNRSREQLKNSRKGK